MLNKIFKLELFFKIQNRTIDISWNHWESATMYAQEGKYTVYATSFSNGHILCTFLWARYWQFANIKILLNVSLLWKLKL